jgi:uncharacterized repeat protein (TIGR03803 family)
MNTGTHTGARALETDGKTPLLTPIVVAALFVGLFGRLAAQTFNVLHSFTPTLTDQSNHYYLPYTNSDGAVPNAGLLLLGNTLYGAAQAGGLGAVGTVFALNTDGSAFTTLYDFTFDFDLTGVGSNPYGGLASSGTTLYGTSSTTYNNQIGTVFALNIDGTGFTTLYEFSPPTYDPSIGAYDNPDGLTPLGTLVLSGNTLYGTAVMGGSAMNGTVFGVTTDGASFTPLYSFTGPPANCEACVVTNSDAAHPRTELILSGNTLYGMGESGGSSGKGTVFAVNTDGTGFTVLHNFTGGNDGANGFVTLDGLRASGDSRLALSGSTLYGAAETGGASGNGTVFKVNTDGTGFTVLHSFTAAIPGTYVNSDGVFPSGLVISPANTLFGTTYYGGSSGNGTVFKLNSDGTGFAVLHNFKVTTGRESHFPYSVINSDGSFPNSLILSGNILYGTALEGGDAGNGTIFSMTFLPQLTIGPAGRNVTVSWPTNYAGFDYTGFTLESATNLASPFVWTPVSPGPVIVNGQYTVTNPISGTRQFYRLAQ